MKLIKANSLKIFVFSKLKLYFSNFEVKIRKFKVRLRLEMKLKPKLFLWAR